MARRTALKLALLAALVLLGHLFALEWLGRQADAISGLRDMAPVFFTRTLQPQAPAPVVAQAPEPPPARPKPRAAPKPRPKASEPRHAEPPAVPLPPAVVAEAPTAEWVVPPEPPAEVPAPAAEIPAAAASAPAAAASAPVLGPNERPLDTWPTDTRLTYRLTGHWRGPLFGDARVLWQREGERYQVRLDVKVQPLFTQVLTSQGDVSPAGLVPRIYEELRPGKRRYAHMGDEVVLLENGRTAKRPAGVQDTASQFVELTHRFATGRAALEVGGTVTVWLARPGSVDRWTYDVVALETLQTPLMGDVQAYHLKPRPIANPRGNITAEMWFAPSLQYLPARIKVLMGDEAWLDLMVEQIEQR